MSLYDIVVTGYVAVLTYVNPPFYLYGLFELPLLWRVGYVCALAIPLSCAACVGLWSLNNWSYHPITQKLASLLPASGSETASNNNTAAVVAGSINMEMRRPDMFNSGIYSQKVSFRLGAVSCLPFTYHTRVATIIIDTMLFIKSMVANQCITVHLNEMHG